jgi:hypothetical protein
MIEEAIYALLTEGLPLSSGSRIYPLRAPEGVAAPYIVYFRAGMTPRHRQDGPLDLRRHTIQISVFGSSYGEARSELDTIRTLLDGYQGTIAGVRISLSILTGERLTYESDSGLFHASADLEVDWRPGA